MHVVNLVQFTLIYMESITLFLKSPPPHTHTHCVWAVSYTHLDVYKRQVCVCVGGACVCVIFLC